MPDKMAFQSNVGEKGMRSDYIMRRRNGNKWPANQSSAAQCALRATKIAVKVHVFIQGNMANSWPYQ
jgi:hypothetical protein